MPSPGEGDKLSFERDIKPLFRTKDRDSMMAAFDLFDYEDVVGQAGDLLHQPAARRGRLVANRLFITQPALTASPATPGAAGDREVRLSATTALTRERRGISLTSVR
jgi:hypothetical protein